MSETPPQGLFESLLFHRNLGLRLVALSPNAVVEMPISDGVRAMSHPLHGGAAAALVDVAGATAAALSPNFEFGRTALVTLDMHVRYLGQPDSNAVRAEAKIRHQTGKMIHVECEVSDTDGKRVALADLSYLLVIRDK